MPADTRAGRPAITRDAIITALRDFYATHGRAPTFSELGRKAARNRALVSYNTITKHCGSVRDALLAAGIPPRKQGQYAHPRAVEASRPKPIPKRVPQSAPPPAPRRQAPRRYIYATDFVLHFPAMRAELARLESIDTSNTGRARRSA